MSNPDSFIDEVNDELRRDRMYATWRRWGWVGVAAVLLLVGGAAWTEWSAARDRAAAQALGDDVLAALEADDPALRADALSAIEAEGEARAVLSLLTAAELQAAGDGAEAARRLTATAADASLPVLWRDLAAFKAATLGVEGPEERIASLDVLANPGAPFRLLALEQIALAQIEMGATDAARETLTAILEDADLREGPRTRAETLMGALGFDPAPAAQAETDE
ncbi:MAG: hypothetical protein ACU0BF_06345 [Paracoccaceae bacterium]